MNRSVISLCAATLTVVCVAVLPRVITPKTASAKAAQSKPAAAASCVLAHWVASWEAAPGDGTTDTAIAPRQRDGVSDQTLRMIITPHRGGRDLRVHLSNRFGKRPLRLAAVSIAERGSGAGLVAHTSTTVTFGGKRAVVIAAGTDAVSDSIPFPFAAFEDLAVSVFVPGTDVEATRHMVGEQTSYLTQERTGDHVSDTAAGAFSESTTSRLFVDGLDVLAAGNVGAVVAFGDSITDGLQSMSRGLASAIGKNGRWPDDLQRRIDALGDPTLSVVDAGISGNRILRKGAVARHGPSGLSRLNADALAQSGVETVIIDEGINDIAQVPHASATEVIHGLDELVQQVHQAHLRAVLTTLTPIGGSGLDSPHLLATRDAVNAWIRSQRVADGVIDFDAAVRDPAHRERINPRYDDGDHVHFSLIGYQAMANAVRISDLPSGYCPA